jgi:hypothetical protein
MGIATLRHTGGTNLTKLLASTGLVAFALFGCEDHLPIPEPEGIVQVVYVDGQPDHCIFLPTGTPALTPVNLAPGEMIIEPAVAHER